MKTEYQEREKELMQCEECSKWADGKDREIEREKARASEVVD